MANAALSNPAAALAEAGRTGEIRTRLLFLLKRGLRPVLMTVAARREALTVVQLRFDLEEAR